MNAQAARLVAIILISGVLISMMVAFTAKQVIVHYQVVPSTTVSDCNLPCKCAPYYNLGTDEWIECMGVGRKPNAINN